MWFRKNSSLSFFQLLIKDIGEIGQRCACLIIKAYVNHGWDPETPSNATDSSSPPKLSLRVQP